jgi:hypothetical protein
MDLFMTKQLKGFRNNSLKKLLHSERGGISTIIATVVTIILVLGLIAYAVLSQVAGVKDTGDKAQIEQQKINQMVQDPNTVTGNVVKNYYSKRSQMNIYVTVRDTTGTSISDVLSVVKDNGLYKMAKTYNTNGELATVSFDQVNLSQ